MTANALNSLLAVAAIFALASCTPPRQATFKGTAIDPPDPLPAQSFTDHAGNPFPIAAPGKATMLAFGYATCSTMCPSVLATFTGTDAQLGENVERVRFGFITIDPERDTPEALADRLNQISNKILGLRYGPEGDGLLKQLGVGVEKVDQNGESYEYNHSGSIFLLDSTGAYRVHHGFGAKPEDVAHDLRLLLQ